MIELRDLKKSFGGRPALHPLNLGVPRGEIFGLLGHNGAGKSTAIGLLLGHLAPDGGGAWINGIHVQTDRFAAIRRTGAIFETPAFYPYLSGYRNLRIFADYSERVPLAKFEEAITLVGLDQRIGDKVKTYSHGMRQRLALAQALLPEPELLILDEPSDGLDPEGIHEMRVTIQRLNREKGMTILFASHLLSEVEQICHRIGILFAGNLIFCGSWRGDNGRGRPHRLRAGKPARAETVLRGRPGLSAEPVGGPGEWLVSPAPDDPPARLLADLAAAGAEVDWFAPEEPSLEAFYLEKLRDWRRRSP